MTNETKYNNYYDVRVKVDINSRRTEHIHNSVADVLCDGVWLAGGALRTFLRRNEEEYVADYDLFFKSQEHLDQTLTQLQEDGWLVVWECPKKELYVLKEEDVEDSEKIQLITRSFYPDMETLINTFDFTVCMAAYDGNEMCLNTAFIRHNRYKRLAINRVTYPVATINRIHKYRIRDFSMYQQDIIDLVVQINEQEFDGEHLVLYID